MSNYTIICVDDEKIILDSLKSQLRTYLGEEFDIETAESGDDALELIEELKAEGAEIPLIITDYVMPRMKGDELLRIVHKDNPNVIKILLTGQATIDGVTNAINTANLYRYIGKPWVREDLELAVHEAINSYKKDRQIEIQHKELLTWSGAFVEAMGTTLDKRDTTTSGHSKRLANFAVKLAEAINGVDYGKYKDFKFSEEEIKELFYAALLHDIGKIGVSESILLKQQRLSEDRLLAIKYRFKWVKSMMESKKKSIGLSQAENDIMNNLSGYLDFILEISKREYITEEEKKKVRDIARIEYVDTDETKKKILEDFELENLTISTGNLTGAERLIIKSHAEHTYNILKGIPWTKDLQKVPEIASSHHEKLDGSGYFRGLSNGDISIQSRILAILDIYEALTSPDRPYKLQKSSEEAIRILWHDVDKGRLDRDILEVFVNQKIYLDI